ncbi:M9 family metallopeptidase N-terminal domain-containing protein [Streptomyces sp. SID8352]|uniref:M9 family metallopeptidase N-terminal domain-containing protein n=1 Tax=Streptomyces sp. SID8352 TaxID=2690338 RepID=UPI001F44EDFE|nr:M9 family metallopeptidase N-terminal domain-containing protein [Streptomyces sp. SID8352]
MAGCAAPGSFREARTVPSADALRDGSPSWPGNASTGMPRLVLCLRAGYYVHCYDADTVGAGASAAGRPAGPPPWPPSGAGRWTGSR